MDNKLTNHIKDKIGKYHVVHSPERNFIWYKNPKTAGTSMYWGIIKNEITDILRYKDDTDKFSTWWNNLTDKNIYDCFTFTFVRNPFDRLVSAFNHVVMENLIRIQLKNETIKQKHLFMLFDLFVMRGLKNWDKDDISMQSASSHWMPQSFFVEFDGYQMVDFVGKYENLETDWKYVANKIQVSEELPFVGISMTGKEYKKTRELIQNIHYSEFYKNQEIIDIVREFYKRDIELFNYELY